MSDINSLNNMAGANPALVKLAPGARTAPEPPTVQNAVGGHPLTTAQSAVTQSPTAGTTAWKREADPDGGQQSLSSATSAQQRLASTVDHLNQHMRAYNTNLQFEVDNASEQVVVRIVDQDTHEVIRQIPSETTLELARFFDDLARQRSQTIPGSKDSRPLKAEGLLIQTTA